MVATVFWEDNYTANLDPIEKLLFLYFLTNTSTSICGIYQITLKKVAVETGIDKDMVVKILARFEADGKIFYREGWLGLHNFIKHQNQNSPKIKKGIEIELEMAPDALKSLVLGKGMDTLSHLIQFNSIKSNVIQRVSRGVKKEFKHTTLGADVLKAFETVDAKNKNYYGNKTQRAACDFLVKEYGLEEVIKRVNVLTKTNKVPFFPSITTPVQLRDKWVQLQDAVDRKRGEAQANKVKII